MSRRSFTGAAALSAAALSAATLSTALLSSPAAAQAAPVQIAPARAILAQPAPEQAVPAQAVPVKAPPAQAVPAQAGKPVAAAPAPSSVARKLFGAWLRRDRAAAARVASPSAVTTLFAYPYRAPDKFAGCVRDVCRFTHTSVSVPGGLGGVVMIVRGSKVAKIYESRHITLPSTVAAYFFTAWKRHDRYRALEVGEGPAVATLFRTAYDPKGVTYFFQGCTPEKKGYACAYSYEGGAMLLHVRGSRSAGYEVRSVGFIAD